MKRLLCLAAALCLCTAASPAKAVGKVYAVLVLDTKGPKLDTSAPENGRLVTDFLEGGIGKQFLNVSTLQDGQVTLDKWKTHLRALPVTSEDTLVCYFMCHGVTDKASGEHVLLLHGDGAREPVRRKDLRAALEARGARLTILLSDSCSSEMAVFGGGRPGIVVLGHLPAKVAVTGRVPGFGRLAPADQVKPCFQKLFLGTKGVVDINGSFFGTYAWCTEGGTGVFTRALNESLRAAQNAAPSDWADFYGDLRLSTQGEYKKMRDKILAKYPARVLVNLPDEEKSNITAMMKQEEQAPQAFFLTGTRLKLVAEAKNEQVTITDLTLDSPARAAGLRVGDIIVQVNGQEVTSLESFRELATKELGMAAPKLVLTVNRVGGTVEITVRVPPRS